MSLKEQIAALPDDLSNPELYFCDGRPTGIFIADLKALADSHTQLVDVARFSNQTSIALLDTALEEAGKL